jgi:CBS domain containing-hemolysin-like protein
MGGFASVPIIWKLLITAIFVILNGFFVAAEFALVKVRPSRIQALADTGDRRAKIISKMMAHLDHYLSACQLGITLASLVLGWLAEPAVAALIIKSADFFGVTIISGPALHLTALILALSIITILHMTIGEQAPKIWAIRRAEHASLLVAYPLRLFAFLLFPMIWLVNGISNMLLRIVGIHGGGHGEDAYDVNELREILLSASRAGNISVRQRALGENILGLMKLEVRHIMLPRVDVVFCSTANTLDENLDLIRKSEHTRYPLGDPDLDHVLGIVHGKDLLSDLLGGNDRPDLKAIVREIQSVPDTLLLSRLIVELQTRQHQCAMVVDEHGTTVGVAYLEDAIEEIVGPIHDEFDNRHSRVKRLEDGSIEVHGAMPLPEAMDLLGLNMGTEEDTVGGYVTALLGRLPEVHEVLTVPGFDVIVLEVTDRRVERIQFVPRATDENKADAE